MAEKMAGRPAENEMVWFMLGAIFERQKKYDLAEGQFKRVLEINPRNAPTLNYYGYMLADLGLRLDEATNLSSARWPRIPTTAPIWTAWAGLTSSRTGWRKPKARCARPSSAMVTTPPFATTWGTFIPSSGVPTSPPPSGKGR